MVLPGAITICFVASDISAPAEIAFLLMKAIVFIFVSINPSLIFTAESNLPPKVSISKIRASAFALSASSKTPSKSRANPLLMVPFSKA